MDEAKSKEWLEAKVHEAAQARGMSGKVTAKWTNNRWEVRVGRAKLGQLDSPTVESRHWQDIESALFRRKTAVRLFVDSQDLDAPLEDIPGMTVWEALWDLTYLWIAVQQAIVQKMLAGEHVRAGQAPGTWAYRQAMGVGLDGKGIVREWMEKRLQAKTEAVAKRNEKKAKAKKKRTGGEDDMEVVTWQPWTPISALMAAATKQITDKYGSWEKTERNDASPPWTHRKSFAIPANSIAIDCVYGKNKDGSDSSRIDALYVTLRILGQIEQSDGKKQNAKKQPVFKVYPKGIGDWQKIRALWHADPKKRYWAHGARVAWDADLKRWAINLTLSMPEPAMAHQGEGRAVVLRRGSFHWLRAMLDDGRMLTLYDQGDPHQLVQIKRQARDRRNRASAHKHYQGQGSRGHGRARFFRARNAVSNREARQVETWIKQMSYANAKKCYEEGVSEVIMEDYGASAPPVHENKHVQAELRRFPYAMLRDAQVAAFAKFGIKVTPVICNYSPDECPACEAKMEEERRGQLVCPECKLRAFGDTIACWHHFRAAGRKLDIFAKSKNEQKCQEASKKRRRTRRKTATAREATTCT